MSQLTLGLAIGVWWAVVYKLSELLFRVAVTVDSATSGACAEECSCSSAVW